MHRRKQGGTKDNLPPFNIMLSDYYEFRGWDEEGLPRTEKVKELSLESFWPIFGKIQ
jgi:aldehyde:ferredoxin oxidoreductase